MLRIKDNPKIYLVIVKDNNKKHPGNIIIKDNITKKIYICW